MKKVKVDEEITLNVRELQQLEASLYLSMVKHRYYYGGDSSIYSYSSKAWYNIVSIMRTNDIEFDLKLADHQAAGELINQKLNK